jgi:hypothetical protein
MMVKMAASDLQQEGKLKFPIAGVLGSILIVLLFWTTTYASPWKFSDIRNSSHSFLLGFMTGYMVHELGHVLVAKTKGYSVELDGMSLVYPDLEEGTSDQLQIATAGFQLQWLVSEAALRYRENRRLSYRENNFNAGLVIFHIANTAAYMTFLKDHEQGDTVGVAKATGLSADQAALLAAIPALLDGWRLFVKEPPAWMPALSAGAKGLGIVAIWSY